MVAHRLWELQLEKQHLSWIASGCGGTPLLQLFPEFPTCNLDGTASMPPIGMHVLLAHAVLVVDVLSG
jgi:hypothetical protein